MKNILRGEHYAARCEDYTTICVALTPEELELFFALKEHYALRTKASVLRMLVVQAARELEASRETATTI